MAKQATMSVNTNMAKAHPAHDYGRFDFIRLAWPMGGISLLLTIAAIVLIFTRGLNYGIDFAGGTEVQVRFNQPVSVKDLRDAIEQVGITNPSIQSFGGSNEFLIRLESPRAATESMIRLSETIVNPIVIGRR